MAKTALIVGIVNHPRHVLQGSVAHDGVCSSLRLSPNLRNSSDVSRDTKR